MAATDPNDHDDGPKCHASLTRSPATNGGLMRSFSVRVYSDVNDMHHLETSTDHTVKGQVKKWWGRRQSDFAIKKQTYALVDWLGCLLPCISWMARYGSPKLLSVQVKDSLLLDIATGLSIGFMIVPQGMSYALLAGLPAVYGLYGSFAPVLVYALFGSSRHVAVGPTAITSLLLGHALREMYPAAKDIRDPNKPDGLESVQTTFNTAAIQAYDLMDLLKTTRPDAAGVQITFLVGIMYLAFGALQLGFIANFLSHAITSGFSSGAAVVIGLSQLKYFFGISTAPSHTGLGTAIELIKHIKETQWREVLMFTAFFVLLLGMKELSSRVPRLHWTKPLGPISICILGIVAVVIGDLDGKKLVKTVHRIPRGLPDVTIQDWLPLKFGEEQALAAVTILLVGFMESLSITKLLAEKYDYHIGVEQEVVSLGLCNLIGAMFSGYVGVGSFSRSAVVASLGSHTPIHGLVTGVVVVLVLRFITKVFERVPYNAMGAIVLASVLNLLDVREAIFLFKANIPDFLVWMAAFLGTIFLGVEIGLGIAVGLAIILVIYQSAAPHTAVLGRLPNTEFFRDVKQYPSAIETQHICVICVDAPIYFANVEWVRRRMQKYMERVSKDTRLGPIHYVVLEMTPVSFVDTTGMRMLHVLHEGLRKKDQRLVLSNPSRAVQEQLQRAKLLQDIGEEWVYVSPADAVRKCLHHLYMQRKAVQEEGMAEDTAKKPDVSLSLPLSAASNQDGMLDGSASSLAHGQDASGEPRIKEAAAIDEGNARIHQSGASRSGAEG